MRVFFVVLLGCSCTVVVAADPQPPGSIPLVLVPGTTAQPADNQPANTATAPTKLDCDQPTPKPLTLSATQVQAILKCIDDAFTAQSDLKCDLIAVDPKQAKDVFGKEFLITMGQPVTLAQKTTWPYVWQAISNAVKSTSSAPTDTFKLRLALRADIPAGTTSCLPGEYVMLMSFDCESMKVYLSGNLVGECPIKGGRNYWQLRRILRDAPSAPAASSG